MIKLDYSFVPFGVTCWRVFSSFTAQKSRGKVKPLPCAKPARKPAVYAAFRSLKRYIPPAVLSHPRSGGGFASGYGTGFAVRLPAVDGELPATALAGFERFAAENGFQRRVERQYRVLKPLAQRTARKSNGEHITGSVQWQASVLTVIVGALGYNQPAHSLLFSGGQLPVWIAHGFPPFWGVCNPLFV